MVLNPLGWFRPLLDKMAAMPRWILLAVVAVLVGSCLTFINQADPLLAGRVSEADLAALHARADIHLCTAKAEPFGLTVLEAAASGTPSRWNSTPRFRWSRPVMRSKGPSG